MAQRPAGDHDATGGGPAVRVRDEARDRLLVLAYRSGDPDAFSIIFDDHYPELLAQARAALGSGGAAEDACQETFRRALEGIGRFGRTGEWRLGAWLSTILHRVCVDHRQRVQRDRLLAAEVAGEAADVADLGPDPDQLLAVKDAISHLRPNLARALVLRELRGLSYAEVALSEHISEECARTRASRARRTLQRRLAS
jgi:RNA polymerase sigma factor (sigma-70 family)